MDEAWLGRFGEPGEAPNSVQCNEMGLSRRLRDPFRHTRFRGPREPPRGARSERVGDTFGEDRDLVARDREKTAADVDSQLAVAGALDPYRVVDQHAERRDVAGEHADVAVDGSG